MIVIRVLPITSDADGWLRGTLIRSPNRDRFGEDGTAMDRSEITTVETVFGIRVHQKDFVGCDAAAASPDGHWTTATVGMLRLSQTDPIDGDAAADPADDLSRQPGHMFEKWDIWWQIAPFRDERGNRVWRSNGDKITRPKMVDRLQAIEANWGRRTGVPEEHCWHVDGSRKGNRSDCDERDACPDAARH